MAYSMLYSEEIPSLLYSENHSKHYIVSNENSVYSVVSTSSEPYSESQWGAKGP